MVLYNWIMTSPPSSRFNMQMYKPFVYIPYETLRKTEMGVPAVSNDTKTLLLRRYGDFRSSSTAWQIEY